MGLCTLFSVIRSIRLVTLWMERDLASLMEVSNCIRKVVPARPVPVMITLWIAWSGMRLILLSFFAKFQRHDKLFYLPLALHNLFIEYAEK